MKKKFLFLLHLIVVTVGVSAQTESNNYKMGINKFIEFYNVGAADSIFNMFNAKMQQALLLEKTRQIVAQLKYQVGDIKTTELTTIKNEIASYKTTFTNGVFAIKIGFDTENKITMLLVQPYQEEKINIIDSSLSEATVNLNTIGASLSGSLITPKNFTGKIPVVLIIAGSGATDRDGNSGGLVSGNSYFLLAQALGKTGIAALRYDKRTVGKSKTIQTEAELRFNDFVNDATAFIKQLKSDPRFSKVFVLGHSEGSLIGMISCEKINANGYISLAGLGEPAYKTLAVQLKNQFPENDKITVARLDSLRKNQMVNAEATDIIFRPSLQPYLISWFKYNPALEIKKLKIPVLIINGTTDIQVSVRDAEILKKAKPDASLVLINNMNHVLKDAPADRDKNLATYNNPLLPISANLISTIVKFVNHLK